jgi:tripartite-type tricarboxylate transporter receptor subunit TctC
MRLVVLYPREGFDDLLRRTVAETMSQSISQPSAVDNKVGASGAVGSDFVRRAAQHCCMLLVAFSDAEAVNRAVMTQLPYTRRKTWLWLLMPSRALIPTLPMEKVDRWTCRWNQLGIRTSSRR